jgi:hypothetical protein
MAEHYSVAWMDRWLKRPDERGYGDADARLLADAEWCPRYSFYLRSARTFPDRKGKMHVAEDIRADCLAGVVDAPAECAPTPLPASACHATTQPQRALLRIKDRTPDTGDQLAWSWLEGAATTRAQLGDPVAGETSYTLCLYDDTAGTSSLVTSGTVPAGGTCAGRPCWSANASGLRYADKNLARKGVKLIRLKAGAAGSASVTWLAKGDNLDFTSLAPLLPFDQSPKVTVQMTNSDGECWTAAYSAPARANDHDGFVDKGD